MTEHLKETGVSYWRHFRRASGFSLLFIAASARLAAHAIYPNFFPTTLDWVKRELKERENLSDGFV